MSNLSLSDLIRDLFADETVDDDMLARAEHIAQTRYEEDMGGRKIPEAHKEAVACYATAYLLDSKAQETISAIDPTMDGDSVDHEGLSGRYAARAASLRKRYHMLLGLPLNRSQPASMRVSG
ncbi:MAG: hypothetical protein AAF442_09350 [Pseudomonadota bacterium]